MSAKRGSSRHSTGPYLKYTNRSLKKLLRNAPTALRERFIK